MPDIDGIETAELIRKHGRTSHTPIIFVTAYADEMQTERGYALGAVDYILSPVVPAILRSKVRVFVDLYRAQRRAAKVARAEAGASRRRGGAAQLRSDRAREPRARGVARARRRAWSGCSRCSCRASAAARCCPSTRTPAPSSCIARIASRRASSRRCRCCRRRSRRAMSEVQSGGYALEIRADAGGSGHWPASLRIAHVLPLKVGERNIGALVLGTAESRVRRRSTTAACSRSRRAPPSRSTTRSSTAA